MGIEVDPTHAGLRSIGGADKRRDLWHDLGKVSGSVAQTGCEGGESVEVLAQTFVDAYSVSTGSIEGQLECTEQAGRSRDGDGDESELSQVALPGFLADAPAVSEIMEDHTFSKK
jgi:hypothetical protein